MTTNETIQTRGAGVFPMAAGDIDLAYRDALGAEYFYLHSQVSNQLRILGVQTCVSRYGSPYTRLQLGNCRGSITAIAWHNRILPTARDLEHGQVHCFRGQFKLLNEQSVYIVNNVQWVDPGKASISALLPREWVLADRLPALSVLIESLQSVKNQHVRLFLVEVLLNTNNVLGLLNSPASKTHHHAYQGGLLVHTAEMLSGLKETPVWYLRTVERDLAIALIVIHDLGKTVTMSDCGRSQRGGHQPHEMAALELLASPMVSLERNLPFAANLLRGFFKPANWYPQTDTRLYREIRRLDRMSADNVEVAEHEAY